MMHIFSLKGKTKKERIKVIPDAPFLYIPLLQNIGRPAIAIVAPGEAVKKHQLIARASEGLSANIHSPVSGTVIDIKEYPLADGTLAETIIIENDFEDSTIQRTDSPPQAADTAGILSLIEAMGIVGEGGAQFPTAVKYKLNGAKINTFIVNGTECEPYLTADYAIMHERTEELFAGINIAGSLLDAKEVVISIEEQNKELQNVFAPLIARSEYSHIRITILPDQYPQGGELQLAKSVTGIEIPRNKLPREYGITVSNVATIYSIYEAVVNRRPLVSRIITVSGKDIRRSGNYEVKIGTPINYILQNLGIDISKKELVLGGPMMGKHIEDTSAPIIKGSSGVLFFEKKKIKRSNCISCGYCVDVCPMHLMPMKFEENYRKRKFFNMEKYRISSCIECAACEYICPSDVPLIESIKEGKLKLKELANAIQ